MGMSLDRSWPITVKVPVAVASMMLLVGFVFGPSASSPVLAIRKSVNLIELSQSYLDGLSSAIARADVELASGSSFSSRLSPYKELAGFGAWTGAPHHHTLAVLVMSIIAAR